MRQTDIVCTDFHIRLKTITSIAIKLNNYLLYNVQIKPIDCT